MRSVIFTSLIIFLAALAGGYCILWYSQANNLRAALERSVDQINSKEQLVTYETITLSGFPWRLEAAILRPHFRGRMVHLIRPISEAAGDVLGKPLPKFPEGWNEEFGSDGQIVFSVNTMANFYTLTFTGNWQHNTTILGKQQDTYVRQEGNTGCTMQMESGAGMLGMLWNFQSAMYDNDTFLSHFRILNCRSDGISVTDSQSNEAIASLGRFSSSITHDAGKNGDEIHFYSKIVDLTTTPQGDGFVARYVHELSPYDFSPSNFSINGKQNSEIDITYIGPLSLQAMPASPTFRISVNNYDVSDALHTLHLKGSLEGNNHLFSVILNSETQYSQLYDKQFPAVASGVIQSIFNDRSKELETLRNSFLQYTPEQVYSIIYPSLFNPSAFGSIFTTLTASYQGTSSFSHGALTINAAKLATRQYGLSIEGTSDIENKEMKNADLILLCTSCTHMENDWIAYLKRIQPTIQYFAPETAHSVAVFTADPDNFKKLLASVSTAPNPSDPSTLRFVISHSPATGITIGQKPIAELFPAVVPVDVVVPTPTTKSKAKPAPTSAPASTSATD